MRILLFDFKLFPLPCRVGFFFFPFLLNSSRCIGYMNPSATVVQYMTLDVELHDGEAWPCDSMFDHDILRVLRRGLRCSLHNM